MGFFAKHGLQMRMPVLESAAVATAALVSGSVRGIQAGPNELVAAQANGQKVVAIQIAYAGFAQTLVLSKAAVAKTKLSQTAPVVERMKALDGLLLASASATSSATVAIKVAALKMAGVNTRWTYIAQTNMQSALEQGAIDGYIASAPFSTFAIAKGLAVSWVSGPNGDLPVEYTPANAGIIMVMRDFAEANPDIIKRMMAAFADFSAAVEQKPDDVKATLARLFPDFDKPSLDLFFSTESRAWRARVRRPSPRWSMKSVSRRTAAWPCRICRASMRRRWCIPEFSGGAACRLVTSRPRRRWALPSVGPVISAQTRDLRSGAQCRPAPVAGP